MNEDRAWKKGETKFAPAPATKEPPKPADIWDDPTAEARVMIVFTPGRKLNSVIDGNFDTRKVKAIITTALKILDQLIALEEQVEAEQALQHHTSLLERIPLDGRN